VLAAGFGTRIRGVAGSTPKPLVAVRGRPVIDRVLDWLLREGVGEAAVNLHHGAAEIQEHLRGRRVGPRLTYSLEGTLLGTAGACIPLRGFLGGLFFVVYGDVLTDLSLARLAAFHRARRAELTMALYRVTNPTECGIVETDERGRVVRIVEKPAPRAVFSDLANAGILVVEDQVLDSVPSDHPSDFARDIIPRLIANDRRVFGFRIPETSTVVDMGTPEGYRRAEAWLRNAPEAHPPDPGGGGQ
jgi:NDP-sugar pyrophosphorylase family protein